MIGTLASPNRFDARHLVVMCFIGGCNRGAQLSPLPADLSAQDRIAAFERLRTSPLQAREFLCTNGSCFKTDNKVLVLGDGTVIRTADQVESVIAPETPSGRAFITKRHHERRFHLLLVPTVLAIVGGLVVAGPDSVSNDPNVHPSTLRSVGGAVLIFGVAGALGVYAGVEAARANAAGREVLVHYDESLAATLHVCVSGLTPTACAPTDPVVPEAPPHDPVLDQLKQR